MFETMSLVRGPAGEPLMFAFQLEPGPEPDTAAHDRTVDADVRAERLPHRLEADPLVDEDPLAELEREETGITPEAIRAALDEDRFVLFCQPVVDLETEQFEYYELLLRLRDAEDTILLPEAFMDAAREGGLRRAIDHWVLARAVKLIDENARAGRSAKLEVNIAAESIADPELPNVIERELASVEIDASLLVLSVSETAAVEQITPTRQLAERLRELGCSVALQQFGSTFGSFRQLDDLPVDYLKLDADLTVTLRESRPAQLVVKAIVEVARAGNKQTIAGFVSDDETLLVLRRLGVDGAQGYRVGRPRPITEVWPPLRTTEQPAA
jgi:EAL domain-containing protein (putative c-di-GMP-specific phosphodiesterase class I)